jgi:RNA polymerase sigma-70 factor (ECF subfamily)
LSSDHNSVAEALLIDRLRAGDDGAYADLVKSLQGSLLRLARTFVSDTGAAEEVVQDTWMGVVKGLPAFEGRSSLKTWIFRILVNRARTRGARDGRMINFSVLEDPEAGQSFLEERFSKDGRWTHPPSMWEEQDPEDILLRRELVTVMRDAIARLPPAQRAVVTLRDMEGVDPAEVCNILAISETNQRVLLHRARTQVRRALEVHMKRA